MHKDMGMPCLHAKIARTSMLMVYTLGIGSKANVGFNLWAFCFSLAGVKVMQVGRNYEDMDGSNFLFSVL